MMFPESIFEIGPMIQGHLEGQLSGSSCCLKHSFIWAFWSFTYWQDRLRWVTFSAENVSQLISYDYMSGKLEQIYPEKQQDCSEKDNGSKHKEGDDARRRNAG